MGQDEQLMKGEYKRIVIWVGGAMLVLGGIYYCFVHRHMKKSPEALWRPLPWTRISVFTARFPAAMDWNNSGNLLNAHSPSTKSSARITPASINSSARRIVAGV